MEETYSAVTTEPIIISDEVAARRKALFDKYVTPYNRMIYKLCMRYTFNPSDIEDNYIEVLTNMYKYIETYNPERSVQTWLHIVTKRCVFDLDQRKKKHQDMLSDDNDVETFSSSESIVDFARIFSKVAVRGEALTRLRTSLSSSSPFAPFRTFASLFINKASA